MRSWSWEVIKIVRKEFLKNVKMFVFISWKKQVKMLVFISWLVSLGVCIQIQYFCDVLRNKLQTIKRSKISKRRSKVQEKNMSCERGLNFDQWKTFSENYKPLRIWLWLVYKFAENYCILRPSLGFIQTQKRCFTSLGIKRILTWKLLVISS